MARVQRVEKCRKVQECGKCGKRIEVGQPYLWWAFRFGGKHVRCCNPGCAPRQSELTQSEFWGQVYDFQDSLSGCETFEDAEAVADEIDSLADEQDDKLSNMPDSLQDSDTGQMLEGRAESCREWAQEIRDCEPEDAEKPWKEVDYSGE